MHFYILFVITVFSLPAFTIGSTSNTRIDSLLDLHFEVRNKDRVKALAVANMALEYSRAASDMHNMAVSLECIAYCHYTNGDFERAKSYYIQALAVYSENAEKTGIASVYNNIGLIEQDQGSFGKALLHFKKALKVDATAVYSAGDSYTLNNIGTVYLYKGHHQKALSYFELAMEIAVKENDTEGRINYYNNIGLVYQSVQELRKAEISFNNALRLAQNNNDQFSAAIALINIGNIFRDKKDFSKAQKTFNQALEIIDQLDDSDLLTECYMAMADAHQINHNYKESNKIILKAKKSNELTGNQRKAGFLLFMTGKNLFYDGYFSPSLDYFRQGLHISKNLGLMPLSAEIYQQMAIALAAITEYDSAARCISLFGELSAKMSLPEDRLDSLGIEGQDTLQRILPQSPQHPKSKVSFSYGKILTALALFWGLILLVLFLYRLIKKHKNERNPS